MRILGIETSCDETSAAVMADGELKSSIVSSHLVHEQYGGVVPELASRAHQQLIVPIVEEALLRAGIGKGQIDGIAVTYGPGLAGASVAGFRRCRCRGPAGAITGCTHWSTFCWNLVVH